MITWTTATVTVYCCLLVDNNNNFQHAAPTHASLSGSDVCIHWLDVSDHIMSTVCLRVQVSTWPGPSSTGQSPLYQDVACRGQLDVRRYQLTTYSERSFVCAAAAA